MTTNRKVRWIALGVGLVVVVLGIVLALNVSGSDPNVTEGRFTGKDVVAPGFALVSDNDTAPAFTLETLDGQPLALSDLEGKTVVVNFWNTWCAPCIQEAPTLREFYELHKDEPDFAMVGIVRDDDKDKVRAYVDAQDVGWTIALDPKSKAALAYGTTGQPETFVIGPDGRVAGEQFSAVTVDNLELMSRGAGHAVTRRLLPWLLLGVIVASALVVLVARSQPSHSDEARARRLERELACPVCTGESVAESNAPEARAIRDDIRDRIADGQSDSAIIDAYATVYGERIKLNPADHGLALVAWGLPVVAVIAGATGVVVALRRWSREPRLPATAEDEVLVARARETELHEDR